MSTKDKINSIFDMAENALDGFGSLMGVEQSTEQDASPASEKQIPHKQISASSTSSTPNRTRNKPIIDVESTEKFDNSSTKSNNSSTDFSEMAIDYWWASHLEPNTKSYTQHAFRENSHFVKEGDPKGIVWCKAICDGEFLARDVQGRAKLEHGKRIIACTSCIIGVSVRG